MTPENQPSLTEYVLLALLAGVCFGLLVLTIVNRTSP